MNPIKDKRVIATLAAAALSVASGTWLVLQTNREDLDAGVTSAVALVSMAPFNAVQGEITLLRVSPEDLTAGRVAVWAGVGSDQSGDITEDHWPSRADDEDRSPTSNSRQAVSLVIGGAAANDFKKCDPNEDSYTFSDLRYRQLSSVEQSAVVANISSQLQDRTSQYGIPTRAGSQRAPVDIATDMSYTIIEPKDLSANEWGMSGEGSNAGTPLKGDSKASSIPIKGYSVGFECDVPIGSLWVAQGSGVRLEWPGFTVSGGAGRGKVYSGASFSILRDKELASYWYQGSTGLEDATVLENWSGMDGRTVSVDQASSDQPTSTVPDATLSFGSSASSSTRDTQIFLAGVAFSIFAALVASGLRRVFALLGWHGEGVG